VSPLVQISSRATAFQFESSSTNSSSHALGNIYFAAKDHCLISISRVEIRFSCKNCSLLYALVSGIWYPKGAFHLKSFKMVQNFRLYVQLVTAVSLTI